METINNDFYDALAERWYTAEDHPVALLRAENAVRVPWILRELSQRLRGSQHVLDVGCGAGLLANPLAEAGHEVVGIDLSESSLAEARNRDRTGRARYLAANAYSLPFPDGWFDVVCAMDLLEHVEDPALVIGEASRVLRPGGLFFFHTFNRNLASYLLVVKGVEWCVDNAPERMHVYSLFIRPSELKEMCDESGLRVETWRGLRPRVNRAFAQLLFTGKVPPQFRFSFSKSLSTGYCGIASRTSGS